MLDYIWSGMLILSLIFSLNAPGEFQNALFEGANGAVETILSIIGVTCLWSGLMEVARKSELIQRISRLISPLIRFLFPDARGKESITEPIVMNISANLFGMGNAATPLGIRAMKELHRVSGKKKPSDSMCMFVLINTASIQLIPSTLLALRAAAGAHESGGILLPIWITSVCALCAGILCAKGLEKLL